MEQRLLTVSLPPHIHAPGTTAGAMWRVVVALIPALACSMWVFGLGAAVVTVISVLACMGTEYFITRFMLKRRPTLGDGSAAHRTVACHESALQSSAMDYCHRSCGGDRYR